MHNNLLAASFSLVDHPAGSGGFIAIPGSHKANFPTPPALIDGSGHADLRGVIVQPETKAGDVILFSEGTVHGAAAWNMDYQRRLVLYRCLLRFSLFLAPPACLSSPLSLSLCLPAFLPPSLCLSRPSPPPPTTHTLSLRPPSLPLVAPKGSRRHLLGTDAHTRTTSRRGGPLAITRACPQRKWPSWNHRTTCGWIGPS